MNPLHKKCYPGVTCMRGFPVLMADLVGALVLYVVKISRLRWKRGDLNFHLDVADDKHTRRVTNILQGVGNFKH